MAQVQPKIPGERGRFSSVRKDDSANVLELSLLAKEPLRDNTKPFEMDAVCAAAEQYFNRSNFASTIPDAGIFGTLPQEEGSGDEDSDDEDEDDEDFDGREVLRRILRLRREKKTKKRYLPEPPHPANSTKPALAHEEHVRTTQFRGPQAEVAELITRLNSMNLDHPEYGSLFYQATTLDPASRVCITRPPPHVIPAAHMASAAGLQGPPSRRFVPITADGQVVKAYPFEPRPPSHLPGAAMTNPHCYGCGEQGHKLPDCLVMRNLQNQGLLKWDHISRKFVRPDGSPIFRRPGEVIAEVVKRSQHVVNNAPSQPQPKAMLLTIPQAVWNFYAQQGDTYEEEEEMMEEEEWETGDEDDGEDDTGFEADTEDEEDEYTTDEYEEQEGETVFRSSVHLGADRGIASSRDARKRQQAGPRKDAREQRPQRRTQAPLQPDGTRANWRDTRPTKRPPIRPPTPTVPSHPHERMGNPLDNPRPSKPSPPEPVKTPSASNEFPSDRMEDIQHTLNPSVPRNPQPYDARHNVFRRAASEAPPSTSQNQQERPHEKRVRIANPEVSKEDSAPRPKPERKTDVARRVNRQSVVSKILDTPIQLPLGEFLGTSRELSSLFHDLTKVRLPAKSATKNNTTHFVRHPLPANPEHQNSVFLTENSQLLDIYLSYNGNVIRAILDSGSMVNVVSSYIFEQYIRLPIDLDKRTVMHDANGGAGELRGAVDKLHLQCGTVDTEGFFYVGEDVPFQMLLGRPWMRGNAVSVDERENGTYIVFKDQHTWKPRYEMLASTIPGKRPMLKVAPRRQAPHIHTYLAGFHTTQSSRFEEIVPDSEEERNNSPDSPAVEEYTLDTGDYLEYDEGFADRQPSSPLHDSLPSTL
ncbi:hypothetical protein V5O48_015168 [Marasmius crinis-equi]|uniref:CCHC-type domain-containing protein n=1 Tax=Marasmius crinis-equi TaxID=585013 RepID=A0ABR3EVB0_9AGAR